MAPSPAAANSRRSDWRRNWLASRGNKALTRSASDIGFLFWRCVAFSKERAMKTSWASTASKVASRWSYALRNGLAPQRTWIWGWKGPGQAACKCYRKLCAFGFDQFSFRLKAQVRDMEQADTVRVQVSIQYRTRSWQTIEVDLGPANVGHVDLIEPSVRGLVELGFPVISPVRCLGLAEQVAQKLHACTGPAAAGQARDRSEERRVGKECR